MAEVVKAQGRAQALRWVRLGFDLLLSIAAAVALAASGTVDGKIGILGAEPAASMVLIVVSAGLLVLEGVLIARRRLATKQLEAEEPELRHRAELGAAAPLRLMRLELRASVKRLASTATSESVSTARRGTAAYAAADRSLDALLGIARVAL